jgi:putative transposase
MLKLVINRNCLYQTAYHLSWCPKFPHDVLAGEVAAEVNQLLEAICCERRTPMIANEVQPNHIHLFLSIPPAAAIADVVKVLKGVSARYLFRCFPALRQRSWGGHLWLPSYYVGTAGAVSTATIDRYIERSEQVAKGR